MGSEWLVALRAWPAASISNAGAHMALGFGSRHAAGNHPLWTDTLFIFLARLSLSILFWAQCASSFYLGHALSASTQLCHPSTSLHDTGSNTSPGYRVVHWAESTGVEFSHGAGDALLEHGLVDRHPSAIVCTVEDCRSLDSSCRGIIDGHARFHDDDHGVEAQGIHFCGPGRAHLRIEGIRLGCPTIFSYYFGSGAAKKSSAAFLLNSGILGLLVGKGKKEDQFM